jgi:hypothetical protein
MHENRETSEAPAAQPGSRSAGEGKSRTARAYVSEESHGGIVPMNHSNKDGNSLAENGEGRTPIKENVRQPNTYSTQSGKGVSQGLANVRKAARENKEMKFTALLHHLTVDLLRESFYSLKRKAAPGIDGVTWQEYEDGLEDRLTDLHGRVHRGAYRAMPLEKSVHRESRWTATPTRGPGYRRQTCPTSRGYHPQPDLRGRLSRLLLTADTYGHLIPGADIAWVDRLDSKTTVGQNATQPQQAENRME